MATSNSISDNRREQAQPSGTSPYLAPVEKPRDVRLKALYRLLGRQFGKPPGWLTVFSARMPLAFTSWMGKVYKLNKKLKLPTDTERIVRVQVDSVNGCGWCMDADRWYVTTKIPELVPKLDALPEYRTSPLFSDKERAALDYATELTEQKRVGPETFAALSRHYSEREICELAWIVSTNHLMNINNVGLGIGSDGLCELSDRTKSTGS
jgi:alkylhydroperoxidase family enzyme